MSGTAIYCLLRTVTGSLDGLKEVEVSQNPMKDFLRSLDGLERT